ncbi:MAG: hypothetical protein WBD40_02270 [Tepidisphaeraceae bacterium]
MPAKTTTKSGLYTTTRTTYRFPLGRADLRELKEKWRRPSLDELLDAVKQGAVATLRRGGAKVRFDKDPAALDKGWAGRAWGMVKMPPAPSPLMLDADRALTLAAIIVTAHDAGDNRMLDAVRLGVLLDRIQVRPFEERERSRRSSGGIASAKTRRKKAAEHEPRIREAVKRYGPAAVNVVATECGCSESTVRAFLKRTRTKC